VLLLRCLVVGSLLFCCCLRLLRLPALRFTFLVYVGWFCVVVGWFALLLLVVVVIVRWLRWLVVVVGFVALRLVGLVGLVGRWLYVCTFVVDVVYRCFVVGRLRWLLVLGCCYVVVGVGWTLVGCCSCWLFGWLRCCCCCWRCWTLVVGTLDVVVVGCCTRWLLVGLLCWLLDVVGRVGWFLLLLYVVVGCPAVYLRWLLFVADVAFGWTLLVVGLRWFGLDYAVAVGLLRLLRLGCCAFVVSF